MTSVPLAAGERHAGLFGLAPTLAAGLLDVVQPDAGRCSGITGLRKIAVVAEAHFATVAPHAGSLGPVAEMAALHVLAAIPNALVLEKMDPDWDGRRLTMAPASDVRGGFAMVPSGPGLGVEIDEVFVGRHPHQSNAGLASGQWPPGTSGATLYHQPRHPRAYLLRQAAGQERETAGRHARRLRTTLAPDHRKPRASPVVPSNRCSRSWSNRTQTG